MIDATCPKCKKRIGWQGSMLDQPACPRCGTQAQVEDLSALQQLLDQDHRLIATHPRDASPRDLQTMRVMAGLSLGQAARLIGIERRDLERFEAGDMELKDFPQFADRMAEIYQCGEKKGGETNG
jgi:DNA-binding transcriptional regulator YiaG